MNVPNESASSEIVSTEIAARPRRRRRRGFLNAKVVRGLAFFVTSASILVAVVASLLAIWKFTGTDVLWRTVATCAVVAGGAVTFSWVNLLFGDERS